MLAATTPPANQDAAEDEQCKQQQEAQYGSDNDTCDSTTAQPMTSSVMTSTRCR